MADLDEAVSLLGQSSGISAQDEAAAFTAETQKPVPPDGLKPSID